MASQLVFTDAEISAWSGLLDSERPSEVSEQEWPTLPQVDAFNPRPLSAGMAFRMATRDQREIAFIINPVAARHLATCILMMGREAGWLDDEGNVIKPSFTLDA